MNDLEKRYMLVILILIISNSMMLYSFYKSSYEEKKSRKGSYLNNQRFWTVLKREGSLVNIKEIIKRKPLSLIVMFSLKSCPACMHERLLWNEMSKIENLNVIGVLNENRTTENESWISNLGLEFPVYHDTSGYIERIQKELNEEQMPLKILTDSTGRVLSYDGPHANISEQYEWFNIIKNEFIPSQKE